VILVESLHDRLEEHVRDRIDLGHLGIQNLDTVFLGVVLEDERDIAAPGQAARIEGQQSIPASRRRSDVAHEFLERRPEFVLCGFDDVDVLTDDLKVFRLRQLLQLPFLAGDAYVVPVF